MDESTSLGDEELSERARSGDLSAFGVLWQRHSRAGLAAARQFSAIADPDDIVSEAYLRIFRATTRGGGPHEAFRPYLYRTIRNIALEWRKRTSSVPLEFADEVPADAPDPETAAIESTITARAFRTLPERWQTVLWYTEVEGMQPAEAAPFLGLSAGSTAALAYRAREGFKKAWLQAHVSDLLVPPDCRWTTERMGDYNRGGLSPRARTRFEKHLTTCTRCSILVEEVDDLSGRLAAVLLPMTLGGIAGAGLLAQRVAEAPNQATAAVTARRAPRVSSRTAVAVAVVGFAAVAAIAAPMVFDPAPTTVSTQPDPNDSNDHPIIQHDPPPTPTQTSTPEPPPPSTPPHTDDGTRSPAPVVSAPVDTTAPPAPVVAAPVEGALTNVAMPLLSGTGEPGATVIIDMLDADGMPLFSVASIVVAGDGTWAALPTAPLADGSHRLGITQTDRAGNRSPQTTAALTVDTVALPPVVDELPAEPQIYLPIVTGLAEPLAEVELRDENDVLLVTAAAGDTGAWSVVLPDPERDGERVVAVQVDRAGNRSSASIPTAALSYLRPSLIAPIDGESLPSNEGSTVVEVRIAGVEGMRVQVFIDDVTTGNVHVLESDPIVRVTPALADGPHSIGVRYFDPDTGRVGSIASVAFTVEP